MPSDYAGCEAIFAKIPSEHTLEAWDQKHVALLCKVLCQIVEDGLSSCVAVINRGGLLNSSIKIMAKSNLGLTLNFGAEWLADEVKIGLLSEDTPRVLLSVSQANLEKLSEICAQKIAIHKIGKIGGDEFCIMHQEKKLYSCTKDSLNKIYNYGLQDYVYANQ
jgi:phosphoribosylformylglycinamidine (FGAM) synthase-like enzyme